MKKLTAILAVLVVILGSVLAVSVYLQTNGVTNETRQGGAAFNESTVKAFKISSLTYQYTNIIYRENVQKLGDFNIPFTKTTLGVRYDGVMEIGVDASQMTVAQTDTTVTITLPPAKILSHTPVAGSTQVLFDNGNLFASNSIPDYVALFDSEEAAMEQRAIDSGLLTTAATNAKDQLRDFVISLPGMDAYTVTVTIATAS